MKWTSGCRPTRTSAVYGPRQSHSAPRLYSSLQQHALPLNTHVVKSFAGSARKLDLYFWLGYRIHNLNAPLTISWEALREQFGSGFTRERDFRAKLAREISEIKETLRKLPGQAHGKRHAAQSRRPRSASAPGPPEHKKPNALNPYQSPNSPLDFGRGTLSELHNPNRRLAPGSENRSRSSADLVANMGFSPQNLVAPWRRLGRASPQTCVAAIYRTEQYRTLPEHSFTEHQTEFSEKDPSKFDKIENLIATATQTC